MLSFDVGLKIGDLKLKSKFISAPMAGVSDYPFRILNRKFGCELAFVEMINARALGYKSKKTKSMLFSDEKDKPLGVQLLGCEPEYIERALDIMSKYKFDILDFNSACPERKVVRRGEGAKLMRDPKKLNSLLKIVVRRTKVPVTVKIRAGWDQDSLNAVDVALAAQDAGVKAVFIHGRTKTQEYSGGVDYKIISDVKKKLNIPLIGSGDVFSAQLAKKMFDETGADAVLVARGALGNPWIFKELESYFKGDNKFFRPSIDEIADTMLEHLKMNVDFHGEIYGVIAMRKFFHCYSKGIKSTRVLREKANTFKTHAAMITLIEEFRHLGNKEKSV